MYEPVMLGAPVNKWQGALFHEACLERFLSGETGSFYRDGEADGTESGIMGERLESLDAIVEKYCVSNDPVKSKLYIGLGCLFTVFSLVGIVIPGWPTVSWAVPAAFLFSISSERMFRWTLTNRFFGTAMFDYYATDKTVPKHAKMGIIGMIALMASSSSYFVWHVSTKGDGVLTNPSSWSGADPGFGAGTILLVGLIGVWYVYCKVPTRD